MIIGGMELQTGDPIEYAKHTGGSGKTQRIKRYTGIIAHITSTVITVDLGKYRDSFTIQDIACGAITIPGMAEITLTTSEINEPYRPIRDEILREAKEFEFTEKPIKEDEPMVKSLPKPSNEELKRVYADCKQDIKFVTGFYKVSKSTARKWLIGAGLLEVNSKPQATTDVNPALNSEELKAVYEGSENSINAVAKYFNMSWTDAKKQLVEAGLYFPTAVTALKIEDETVSSTADNKTDSAPNVNKAVTKSSTLVRKADGTVDWEVMWPIVKAELDKGRDKYEVAAELGITRPSIQKQFKRRNLLENKSKPIAKIEKPKTPFDQYRDKSRDELLAIKAHLIAEGEFIDVTISCIDKTLKEAKKNAAV